MTQNQIENFVGLSKLKARAGYKYVGTGSVLNPLTVVLNITRSEMFGMDSDHFNCNNRGDSETIDYYVTNEMWNRIFPPDIYESKLEDQIAYAKTLLNKPVTNRMGGGYTYDSYRVATDLRYLVSNCSPNIVSKFKVAENPFVYLMVENSMGYFTALLNEVTLSPKCEEVKLNDTHTARVSRDGVEVGFQRFTFEAIDNLKDACDLMRDNTQ